MIAAATLAASHADLIGVYWAASQNDSQLSAARHAYRAQVEAVPQARAGLLPEVTAGATTEKTHLLSVKVVAINGFIKRSYC